MTDDDRPAEDHRRVPEKPARDWIPNPDGHPETLVASHPGNLHRATHGVFSKRVREPRAAEVADALMALPHVVEVDEVAALVVGDLFALHEALTGELAKCLERLRSEDEDDHGPAAARLARFAEIELRTAGRLMEGLDRFAASPSSRARWRRDFAAGETLAETARRVRDAKAA